MHTPFMDKQQSPHRRDSAGGRLKQRLAQLLSRSACTTNATSAASSGRATAFVSLAKTNTHPEPEAPPSPYFCTPCTYDRHPTAVVDERGTRPRRRHRSRSASLIHISVDCTGASGRRSVRSDAPLLRDHLSVPPGREVVKNKRQIKGSTKLTAAARSPSASRRHCSSSTSSSWGRARRPSSMPTPYGWSSSSSSTATDDELAPSSGGGSDEEGGGSGEAETRTLFSSLSFSSSDSTSGGFYQYHRTNVVGGGNTGSRRIHSHSNGALSRRRRRAPRRAAPSRASGGDAAPPDAFRPLVVSVERKNNREEEGRLDDKSTKLTMTGAAAEPATTTATGGAGMAVVKRSSNPYLDFRSSMVEMVVERRIGSVGKMEELLGSYLHLNSPRHHPAILAAFEDVWEAVFGEE